MLTQVAGALPAYDQGVRNAEAAIWRLGAFQ
jgi:hypothetical protein